MLLIANFVCAKKDTNMGITNSLKTYRKKRTFSQTPEPKASKKSRSEKRIFVVQKHDASHLHYDFRIQIGRVLKSWAIPKGPPTKIGEKRLAVETEDHPLDYATFEGTIPEGHYGAGTVKVWDSGTFESILKKGGKTVSAKRGYQNGEIKIWLEGKKLKGPYVLVQTKMHGDDKNWLMMKAQEKK